MSLRFSAFLSIFTLSLIFLLFPTQSISAQERSLAEVTAEKQIQFARSLFWAESDRESEKETENRLSAPMTVWLPLTALADGARGETQKEMLSALHFTEFGENERKGIADFREWCNRSLRLSDVYSASRFWVSDQLNFNDNYLENLRRYWNTDFQTAPFSTNMAECQKMMNEWITEQTDGNLTEVPTHIINKDTAFCLVSALYFRCQWDKPFRREETTDKPFYLLDGTEKEVKMMTKSLFSVTGYAGKSFSAIRLPYTDNLYEMVILLPYKCDGLAEMKAELTPELWKTLFLPESKAWQNGEVNLQFPRFTHNEARSMNDSLKALGIKKAFQETVADFSTIESTEQLFIQDTLYQAGIQVDEEGTVAYAMMVLGGMGGFAPDSVSYFIVDHPFMYVIRDVNSGAILFVGQCVEP